MKYIKELYRSENRREENIYLKNIKSKEDSIISNVICTTFAKIFRCNFEVYYVVNDIVLKIAYGGKRYYSIVGALKLSQRNQYVWHYMKNTYKYSNSRWLIKKYPSTKEDSSLLILWSKGDGDRVLLGILAGLKP